MEASRWVTLLVVPESTTAVCLPRPSLLQPQMGCLVWSTATALLSERYIWQSGNEGFSIASGDWHRSSWETHEHEVWELIAIQLQFRANSLTYSRSPEIENALG
jgi:hypothetical protein